MSKIDLDSLNEPQRAAAKQLEGPVLILAGAGTGKTRVITTRIAYMVDEGIHPSDILAVTFTNKAANEMRERVGDLVPKYAAPHLTICTFHSLCVRILRTGIERLGYKKNFTIYTGSEQTGLIRKIIVRLAGKDERMEPGLALSIIGRAKNTGEPVSDNPDALIAHIAKAYEEDKKSMNAVDFDDLLILAVRLLEEHPEVRAEWKKRFSFIMVDEFQDTNKLQMSLLLNLADERENVCVVGDDDQSIYGWRGADISNILEFERFFSNPQVVKLEQNYRSTNPILETANGVIRNNTSRREKRLWSSNPGEDKIRVVGAPDERQEAEFVIEDIFSEHSTEAKPWEEFAILFRMNAQSRLLEENLRRLEIPYRLVGGKSFFDRREIKDFLAYLQVIVNPNDDINLLRIINSPPRGIGKTTIALATEDSIQAQKSIYEILQSTEFQNKISRKNQGSVGKFIQMLHRYGDAALSRMTNYGELAGRLVDEVGFIDDVKKGCKTPAEGESREENVREMINAVHTHYGKNEGKGLQGYLDEVALMQDRDDDDDISKKKGVCLITLHASKGLEFPNCYLVGFEEGILPHQRSLDEGSCDEERRLLYVGITRAMKKLTISYALSRKKYGDTIPCQPSSFLKELDRTHVEEVPWNEVEGGPATQEEAMTSFAQMKAMLSGIEGKELPEE